jgi:L-ribulose-5-phosphate 4-epimerase
MYEKDKQAIIDAALEIKSVGLIHMTGGNVSIREPNGDIIVTPSGLPYETMTPDMLIVLDAEGNKKEGNLRPSVDTVAILHIFKHLKDVNAVIHTHQPYATAVGLIADELPAVTTTLCNACWGPVTVAPYSSAASLEMGIKTVDYINGKLAVILKHHGVIAVGKDLNQALFSAIYLEDTAKCFLAAKAASQNVRTLDAEQIHTAVEVFKDYGQK